MHYELRHYQVYATYKGGSDRIYVLILVQYLLYLQKWRFAFCFLCWISYITSASSRCCFYILNCPVQVQSSFTSSNNNRVAVAFTSCIALLRALLSVSYSIQQMQGTYIPYISMQ